MNNKLSCVQRTVYENLLKASDKINSIKGSGNYMIVRFNFRRLLKLDKILCQI